MKIIVMKFGGTSLAEPEKIKVMAERAVKTRNRGFAVVMAVSAPADLTDDLITLAGLITSKPQPREYDALLSTGEALSAALMAMAINERGTAAVSLSGAQAGIKTDSAHTGAAVISVSPERIMRELKKGRIAVAAGFQGMDKAGDITTLGRGGSDFTAVALARSLKAEVCELYTDVKGIYTANPTVVPQAKKIKKISYDAVMELARAGAEVRQLRAIAYAKKHNIALHLRSSFENEEGTLVGNFKPSGKKPRVVCFSIRKAGDTAEIRLIGAGLKDTGVKNVIRQTALTNGHLLIREAYTPSRITLATSFRSGERLLKNLHEVFIDTTEWTALSKVCSCAMDTVPVKAIE
ncbi:MAG: aspartate kinase [Elusimicrobia bacterium]|nr:aspartate kinase [Elusimicrobiota bacterium]